MGNSFSAGNSVFVHTDKPAYTSGDTVNGVVYLNLMTPVNSKGVFVKVTGFERVFWEERHTRYITDNNGQQRHEHYHVPHSGTNEFFKVKLPIHMVQGVFSPGQYQFPFAFHLPQGLPGNFVESGVKNTTKFQCRVNYKIKAECDVAGFLKSNVKHTQPLIVYERLMQSIMPITREGSSNVTQCCCINKGRAALRVHLDKSCYVPGVTVNVVCDIDNDSEIDLPRIKVKLYRQLILHSNMGHSFREVECLAEQDYNGIAKKSSETGQKARYVPLQLYANRSRETIQPETNGRNVRCNYWCEVELDVPFGSDVKVDVPVTIYAAQPNMNTWNPQAPPNWHPQIFPTVSLNIPMAVPPPVPYSPPQGGYNSPPPQQGYQPPQQQYQAQPQYSGVPPPNYGAPPPSYGTAPPQQQVMYNGNMKSEQSPLLPNNGR